MASSTLPDPGDRNPTLSDDQLRLYLRPECCISFALQAVVRELLERREGLHDRSVSVLSLTRKVDQLVASAERSSISSYKRKEYAESERWSGQAKAFKQVYKFLTTGEWET